MAKKKKIEKPFGIRRLPDGKCKLQFATSEEAELAMETFTYPQDFEIVNLIQHPEFIWNLA